jgi:amino acid transporter
MNIFLQRYEAVDLLSNVSEGVFPFIWLEEVLQYQIEILVIVTVFKF